MHCQCPSRSGPDEEAYVAWKTSLDIESASSRSCWGSGRSNCAANEGAAQIADGVEAAEIMCRSSLGRGIDRRSSNDPQRGVGLDQTPLRVATTSRFGTSATLDLSTRGTQGS